MKQCRISTHNQVIEVFEKGFYDNCNNVQLLNEITDCPNTVQPIMWHINGQWLQELEHQIHIPSPPLSVDQLVDLLKWNGIEVYPL